MSVITGLSAGRLDGRITIQNAVQAQTSSGALQITYADYLTTWCEVRPPTTKEIQSIGQTVGQIDQVFLIRWSTGVTQTSRILYDSGLGQQTYEILGPPEEIQRRNGLRIRTRALRTT